MMFIGQNVLNQNAEGSLKRTWMKSVLGMNTFHRRLGFAGLSKKEF